MIGAGGVERIVEIALNPDEQAAFDKSCAAVKELIEAYLAKNRSSTVPRRKLVWRMISRALLRSWERRRISLAC